MDLVVGGTGVFVGVGVGFVAATPFENSDVLAESSIAVAVMNPPREAGLSI